MGVSPGQKEVTVITKITARRGSVVLFLCNHLKALNFEMYNLRNLF